MNRVLCLLTLLVIATSTVVPDAAGQPQNDSAKQALQSLRNSASLKAQSRTRTKEQADGEKRAQAAALVTAATEAREFVAKYPDDPGAAEARTLEVKCLFFALRFGDASQEARAQQAAKEFLSDDRNSRRDKYVVASLSKQWATEKKGRSNIQSRFSDYEKNAAELFAEYSDVPEVYYLFLGLARNAPTAAKSRKIADDLVAKPGVPSAVKAAAQSVLARIDMPGKPLSLRLTLNDGSEFDAAKPLGQPAVIYFWANVGRATTIGLPALRKAVAEWRAEFVGVNVDPKASDAALAPDGEPPPGRQHWSPGGMDSAVARQVHLAQVPSVYVIDAQGVLRGIGAISDLTRLLAEAGATPLVTQSK